MYLNRCASDCTPGTIGPGMYFGMYGSNRTTTCLMASGVYASPIQCDYGTFGLPLLPILCPINLPQCKVRKYRNRSFKS